MGLEKIVEERKLIFDTCSLAPRGKNLQKELYDGIQGLRRVNISLIKTRIEILGELASLDVDSKLIVLNEVHKEICEELDILNRQLNYINKNLKDNNKIRYGGQIIRVKIDESDKTKLDLLQQFTRRLYRFTRKTRINPLKQLSSKELEECSAYFDIALNLFNSGEKGRYTNKVRYANEGKSQIKNPRKTGEQLCTDQMIVAVAYLFSHKNPVAILTGDKGLIQLARDFRDAIKNENVLRQYSLKKHPRQDIIVYDPISKYEETIILN